MVRALMTLTMVAAVGCGGHGSGGGYDGGPADGSGGGYDGGPADDPIAARCPGGHGEKLKFPREASCANDGGVEFCIPDNEPSLLTQISAISSTIRCAPGGGRANCLRMPGLLLCSYPTSFPAECTSPHGAMTEAVWSDMCAIAEFPQVLEIVPTIFE
jgi:hypothetical protein